MQSKTYKPSPTHSDVIKVNYLRPGDCISTDQDECRVKGMLPNTRGKEDPQNMFCGGTIFIDHAIAKVDMHHQASLGASDTVRCKELYEQEVMEC